MLQILQSEASECGIACLAMIASHYGYETDISTLRQKFLVSIQGSTLSQIINFASKLNFTCRALRLDVNEAEKLQLPCILHWNLNHFVVLAKIKRKLSGDVVFYVFDPVHGERQLSLAEFSNCFTGVALELLPAPSFQKKNDKKNIRLADLIGTVHGFREAILKLIILAFTMELFVVLAPLFNQFILDEIVVSADKDLLFVLLFGFGLLALTQNAISFARSYFLLRWNLDVSLQWSLRVFNHLIKLPLSFFEKRHVGDIVSKFSSVNVIQNTLTSVLIESVLDGFLAILSLILMFLYSLKLAFVALVSVVCYGILRWLFYKPTLEATRGKIVFMSRESSHFLESLRAITPIKLFGKESERISRWNNIKISVQNKDFASQRLGLYFKLFGSLVFAIENLSVLYVGANEVINNAITIGMLMAFMSYSNTFTSKFGNLIDIFASVKMLKIHGERLSDIVLHRSEESDSANYDLSSISKNITLKNVSFRYGDEEPLVLDNINLTIPFGQSVALTGASGCGKTTLCKIILGLIKPTRGEVLLGGVSIEKIGVNNYRRLLGTVMQDDVLLAGTIADNISFFDSQFDQADVERCATLAAVHEDIIKMPMGYLTLVGDMGSSLSGGQKQRILLARALYKKPTLLALDEATSHLDIYNEKRVIEALLSLNLTRIMVAHRPETIISAQRVIKLEKGKIFDVENINF